MFAQPRGGRAVVAYVAAWVCAAAIVVVPAVLLLAPDHDTSVSVPPIRDTQLADAAHRGGCVVLRADAGEGLDPPVDGPAHRRPAHAGIYARPVPRAALGAALRHGVIAIQFRPGLRSDELGALEDIQSALPAGTILAPDGTRMPYALAVTGFRRLLGCPRVSPAALDAVQLFRGRFVGTGPEAR